MNRCAFALAINYLELEDWEHVVRVSGEARAGDRAPDDLRVAHRGRPRADGDEPERLEVGLD